MFGTYLALEKQEALLFRGDFMKIDHMLLIAILILAKPAYSENMCKNDNSITCLKKHFNILYDKDYVTFWKILHESANAAMECKSKQDVLQFLELAKYNNNAEFSEFFAESLEKLCIDNTTCFMDSMLLVDAKLRSILLNKLQNPLFSDKESIDAIFIKALKSEKYSKLSEQYFKSNNRK